VARTRP